MISIMVQKELRAIYASPKFVAVVAVCSMLLMLSVYLGIREYRTALDQFAADNNLVSQEMREARQWMTLNNRIYREPNPLQIFAAGVQYDVGRYSGISSFEPVKLVHSAYTDDPIFAVFRFLDAAFIVQVIFTLLAVLFTYDAINGERERGTLQLIFSNAVPKVQYIVAKFVGLWIGLAVPLAISLLLSMMLLVVFQVRLDAGQWLTLGLMCGMSLLLFTFFVALGVLVSALTRHSNVSFLILLVSWVAIVLIIPRTGVMASEQLMRVPTAAQIASRQDIYAKDRSNQWASRMQSVWRDREEAMRGMNAQERDAYRKEHEAAWSEADEAERSTMQKEIDDHARLLNEAMRNSKAEQEHLALTLARISPAAVYHLAMMTLAGTDLSIKASYEDAMQAYRRTFNAFKDERRKSSGASGGIRITFDTDKGLKIDAGRDIALDLSGMPQFKRSGSSILELIKASSLDAFMLSAEIVLALACAFIAFLRYDVR